jgi:hypothetical protein
MMSRLFQYIGLLGVVLCLVLSFAGCLSSYVVSDKPDSLSYSYEKVNHYLEGKEGTIALLNGQELKISNAVLASDSSHFLAQSCGKQVSVPTRQIQAIEHTDKGQGVIEGLEIGAITGSAFGLSVILGSRLHSTGYDPNPAGPYIILGSAGAIVGGLFGTLAGSSIGHVDRYILNPKNPPGTDTQFSHLPDSSVIHRDAITVDVASSFQGSDFEGGWRTTRALRAGFGRIVSTTLAVNGHLEYYEFRISPANGNSGLVPQSARRRDLALYADVSLVRVIVMGIGVYYTTSDPVYQVSPFYRDQLKFFDSGFSAGRLFVTVGLAYDIHITDELFVPIGFYYRSSYAMNMAFPFFGRVGVGVSF